MAAPTFTVVSRREGGQFPPSSLVTEVFGLLVTDGNNGATADEIPASIFGMTYIHKVSPFVLSTGAAIEIGAPVYSATGLSTSIVTKNAASGALLDLPSGTYAVTVTGS